MAMATYIGGILETFTISQDAIKRSDIQYFYEPKYAYADGAVPKWAITRDETLIGFQDLYVTDRLIYGLVYGVPRTDLNNTLPKLIIFDWHGKPLHEYRFNETLESIAVDEDGTIYGVAITQEGEYSLNKYQALDL